LKDYQKKLRDIKVAEKKASQETNIARSVFDASVFKINSELDTVRDRIYRECPVVAINNITPAALPLGDQLIVEALSLEERRVKRKVLVKEYKLNLLSQFDNKILTLEELIDKIK
jgi:hypothetical protein